MFHQCFFLMVLVSQVFFMKKEHLHYLSSIFTDFYLLMEKMSMKFLFDLTIED